MEQTNAKKTNVPNILGEEVTRFVPHSEYYLQYRSIDVGDIDI